MTEQAIEPLKDMLQSIMDRLCAIETKVGIEGVPVASSSSRSKAIVVEDSPAYAAYKVHVSTFVTPLVETCRKLSEEDPKMNDIGASIQNAWDGIGTIVELASKCKKPAGGTEKIHQALVPYLKQTQDAVAGARQLRLKRDFDNHQKALMEMFAANSWVLMFPPPVAPSGHVKETLGSMEFYSNKVRKQYKGVEGKEAHIAFCDQTKALIMDLTAYTKEHHNLGLTFNPQGCGTLEEGAKLLQSKEAPSKEAPSKESKKSGGIGALMSELATKQTSDGTSAATGLRKVTKDQQTWRKEFQATGGEVKPVQVTKPTTTTTTKSAPSQKPPVMEFDKIGHKWKIEYQTKETNSHLKVEVKDVKEQVYIYKCSNMTVEISGKLKAIVVDGCQKVNVVFATVISGIEIVNSKSIQVQTLGVCPTMSIDKTDGFMVYLSKETMNETSFMTSKSSEMNVSWPDDKGEMLETPIPEQFQHKLVNGSITSTVSDLYH